MKEWTNQQGAQLSQTVHLVCQQCGVQAVTIAWDVMKAWYVTLEGEEVHAFLERIQQEKSDQDEALRIVKLSQWPLAGANLHYVR